MLRILPSKLDPVSTGERKTMRAEAPSRELWEVFYVRRSFTIIF